MISEPDFSVSEFVAVLNQSLEYAYPLASVSGEIAHFKVSKNRWVYFDLKDEFASVRCFASAYQLPGPLEDGMVVAVRAAPRLHPQFGFSLNVQSMAVRGEGSIKKAAVLLKAKLAAEGLFAPERKRLLPHPPRRIGLITSSESAAYRDFLKVLNARWGGLTIMLADVQVQGEAAPAQIVEAITACNQLEEPLDVLVITRGGGSAEDLQAFSTEQVTRAVATSRIPTLVAIGHEVDMSLAELAADQRASTPSNAAELLVPDKKAVLRQLQGSRQHLETLANGVFREARTHLKRVQADMSVQAAAVLARSREQLTLKAQVLEAFNPEAALRRGYALARAEDGTILRSASQVRAGDQLAVIFHDSELTAEVKRTTIKGNGKG